MAAAMLVLFATVHAIELYNAGNEVAGWSAAIPSKGEQASWQVKLWSAKHAAGLFKVWLDVWAAGALVMLVLAGHDPAHWARFWPFTVVVFATFGVIGRILVGWVFGITAPNIVDDPEPASWAVTILQYLLAPVVMPFLGFITTGLVLAAFGFTGGMIYLAIVIMPTLIIAALRERETRRFMQRQQQDEAELYVGRLARWLHGERLGALPDDGKGSRFAYPAEIEAVQQPDGIAFGFLNEQPVRLNTEKHVFIQASTRSGKGVAVIIPHLLRYPGSVFVLDPKGENARACGRQRAVLNDFVHALDPFGISGRPRSRFNPLSRFTPANMEAASKSLATAFFNGERDHWTASGMQLLAVFILYVYASEQIPPAMKDLNCVRQLLLGRAVETLKDMTEGEDALLCDGMLASVAKSFLATPEKERGSIISSAQRETEILDNPAIAACLSATGEGEEVDFGAWRRGTMSVFLCLSAPKFPVFARWLRLVLTAALDEMTDVLDPPPLPVSFILDELASLGTMENVANAVSLAAGYGAQLMVVFQDQAQMRDLYKSRWPSFIGNAGIRVVFNLDDYESAEYWTKFIGTDSAMGQTHNVFGMPVQRPTGEPLLSPDEMMRLFAANKMLVLAQGLRPFITDRVPYFRDLTLHGLWDDPRGALPPAAPIAPPGPPEPEPPEPNGAAAGEAVPSSPVPPSATSAPSAPAAKLNGVAGFPAMPTDRAPPPETI